MIHIASAASDKLRRHPAEGTRSPRVKDGTGHPLVDDKLADDWLEANLSAIDENAFFSPGLEFSVISNGKRLITEGW